MSLFEKIRPLQYTNNCLLGLRMHFFDTPVILWLSTSLA